MVRKTISVVFISVFFFVLLWPKDAHPKLYLISLFINDEDKYEWVENYCGKYHKVYERDYCRGYMTEKYIGKKQHR